MIGPSVVALGGGHGLAASLAALRHVTDDLTAVVTVADDGGSSGRLRADYGVLPPGDLRMALSALCDDSQWGHLWRDVLQHRFAGDGPLAGHAVGNLLIVALWDLLDDDPVTGLEMVGRLLGARGRVLPMSTVPLDITATVRGLAPDAPETDTMLRGQATVATTTGQVRAVALEPSAPPASDLAVAAVRDADWVVLGPGSWFTSVLPHLLVPDLARAIQETKARRLLTLNLALDGETNGYTAGSHLDVLATHAPGLAFDVVLADRSLVRDDDGGLADACERLGARLVVADVARVDAPGVHDPLRLAAAYRDLFD